MLVVNNVMPFVIVVMSAKDVTHAMRVILASRRLLRNVYKSVI